MRGERLQVRRVGEPGDQAGHRTRADAAKADRDAVGRHDQRTLASVAPSALSMPSARSRRCAITVNPATATRPVKTMPSTATANSVAWVTPRGQEVGWKQKILGFANVATFTEAFAGILGRCSFTPVRAMPPLPRRASCVPHRRSAVPDAVRERRGALSALVLSASSLSCLSC